MRIIEILKEPKSSRSYIGGGVFIDTPENLPKEKNTGQFLTHFMTLNHDFFPEQIIPKEYQISIFLPPKYAIFSLESKSNYHERKLKLLRSFSISGKFCDTQNIGSCVFLHKIRNKETISDATNVFQKYFLQARPATDREMQEEMEDDFIAWMKTKLYGKPGFLQKGPEKIATMSFCLQIFEEDLVAIDKSYEGIFSDGAGYLFLKESITTQDNNTSVGLFFAQYT